MEAQRKYETTKKPDRSSEAYRKALDTFKSLGGIGAANGGAEITMDEIVAEVKAVRRERNERRNHPCN